MRNGFWLFFLWLSLVSSAANAAITCDISDTFEQVASDNFSSDSGLWRASNFDRSVSNWPGERHRTTENGNELLRFNFRENRLNISGNNEYGMAAYNFGELITNQANHYAIQARIRANIGGFRNVTNNDLGIVFGYQDDNNYYLARWTKIGAIYRVVPGFPGTFRQLDLVKVSNGVATLLDSAPSTGTSAGNNFTMKVVVTEEGTGVCLGNAGGNNMALVLSSNEIPALNTTGLYSFDNDNGIWYDDFQVRCNDCQQLLAHYRMDEQAWNGSANGVIDQTGNFAATAINGPMTKDLLPALTGDPGTCRYGSFDGVNDYIELPSNFDNLQGSFTITAWINPSNLDKGSRIFTDDENNSEKGFGFSLGDPGNGRLRFYSRGVDPISVDTVSSIPANTWTFVAAVHDSVNKTRQIYINGEAQQITGGSTINNYKGNWGTASGPATIGGETDSGETANRFTGDMDEVRVYRGALSSAQIRGVYQARHACQDEGLLAHYNFEQSDISGQIDDISGAGNHATNINGVLDTDSKFCRGFDAGGQNTNVGTSNAFRSSLDLDDDVGNQGTISFWFNSDIDWNAGRERVLFDASCTGNPNCGSDRDKYFVLEIAENGRLKFSVEDSRDRDLSFQEPSANRQANQWYYVTATWDYSANQFELYVNGDFRRARRFNSSGQVNDLNRIVFGDNASNYARANRSNLASTHSSQGRFDEVRIYNRVLSEAEIQADMQMGADCVDNKRVFQIRHDGLGLTCEPEPIQIVACTNGDCKNIDRAISTDISLAINGGSARTISLTNGQSPDLSDVNRAEINYNQAGNATLSLNLGADNTFECGDLGGNTQSCDVVFATAGFVFEGVQNGTAGVPIENVTLEAKQDNGSGQCQTLFVNQNRNVELALIYLTPTDKASNPYTIDDTVIPDLNDGNFPALNLRFNADGKATLENNVYKDAGQVQLLARYTEPASLPEQPGFTLLGNSGAFWVRPDRFSITSNLSGKHKAGESFALTISALNSDGDVTSNYRASDGNLELYVERTLPTASGSVDGDLTLQTINSIVRDARLSTDNNFSGFQAAQLVFSNGVYSSNEVNYDEVGAVLVNARDSNYGGVNQNNWQVDGDALALGNFTPNHFTQTVEKHGSLSGVCGAFAYSGHTTTGSTSGTINYQTVPELRVIARNKAGGITENYRDFGTVNGVSEDFMMLERDDVTLEAVTQDSNQLGAEGALMRLTSHLTTPSNPWRPALDSGGAVQGGQYLYTLNSMDSFVYTRDNNAVANPFIPEFTINLDSIIDDDGITDADTAGITLGAGLSGLTPIVFTDVNSNLEVRFGRLVLSNSFGPETAAVSQPFLTEYLVDAANQQFATNTADNCSQIEIQNAAWRFSTPASSSDTHLVASDISIDTSKLTEQQRNLGFATFAAGQFNDILLGSGGKRGSIAVEYTTPTWLQYDWDNNGTHDNNATAIATFGRYRGNDRIIYWREVNN